MLLAFEAGIQTLDYCITAAVLHCNAEPAMRNLIIDGAAGGDTKIRHDVTFPLLTLHRGKDRVHFSTGFFQKEDVVCTGVLQIFRTKNR
jgi:hypothetical protein